MNVTLTDNNGKGFFKISQIEINIQRVFLLLIIIKKEIKKSSKINFWIWLKIYIDLSRLINWKINWIFHKKYAIMNIWIFIFLFSCSINYEKILLVLQLKTDSLPRNVLFSNSPSARDWLIDCRFQKKHGNYGKWPPVFFRFQKMECSSNKHSETCLWVDITEILLQKFPHFRVNFEGF